MTFLAGELEELSLSAIQAGAFAADSSESYYDYGWVVSTLRTCGVRFKSLLSAYEELLRQWERKARADRQLHLYRALASLLG